MYKHIATVSFIKQEGNGPTERASEAKSGLRFEISDLNYLDIHVHIAYMVPYDGLWGHYSLQTASEVKSDFRFEISDLNYLLIHMHFAYTVWTLGILRGHYSLKTASEVKTLCLLVFGCCNLNYFVIMCLLQSAATSLFLDLSWWHSYVPLIYVAAL